MFRPAAREPPVTDLPDPAEQGAPDWATVRRRAVRGYAWWAATYPLLKIIQIGGSIVLAALLSPAAFGIVAIASVVVRAVTMFSEFGVGAALIQSRRSDDAYVNTAWTMQILRGLLVFAASLALAAPMARWYGADMLRYLVPAIGVGAVIDGLRSTKYALLNRELRERPRALLHVGESLLTRVTMIGLALVWPSAWCLVIGTLSGLTLVTIVSHLFPGTRNRLYWDAEAARALMRFGSWVFVGTIIAFLGGQLDALILGKLVTSGAGALGVVGVYEIAQRVARLPIEAADVLGRQIAFPVLSEVARRDLQRFQERLMQVRSALLPMGVTLCLGVVVFGPWFFDVFYDDRYAAARWIAPLLTFAVWIGLLNSYANSALLSLGLTRALAISSAVGALASIAGAITGHILAGVPGFIVGIAIGKLLEHITDLVFLSSAGVRVYRQDAVFTIVFGLLGGLCAGLHALAHWIDTPAARWGLGAALPVLIFAAVAAHTARGALQIARRK